MWWVFIPHSGRFSPRERTPGTGGWMDLGAALDWCGKFRLYWDSIQGPSIYIASRYTHWTIPAHIVDYRNFKLSWTLEGSMLKLSILYTVQTIVLNNGG